MKSIKYWKIAGLGIYATLVLALTGCGGGGGGGAPTPEDLDGDGIPNVRDAFPNDPARFSAFTVKTLDNLPSGVFGAAVDINGNRQVVGLSDGGAQVIKAALWTVSADGTPSAPTPLRPITGNSYSAAYGINEAGVIVGESGSNSDGVFTAVSWPAGAGAATDPVILKPLSTGLNPMSAAYGINGTGQIAGEAEETAGSGKAVPVLWNSASADPIKLGLLSGGTFGAAYYISEDGTVVGESETSGGAVRAVRWKVNASGAVTDGPDDLGTLSGHVNSVAMGVSASGQIVGESESATGEIRAVMWTEGMLFGYNIADLGLAGAKSSAYAINDFDFIVGWADSGSSLASLWNALRTPVTSFDTVSSSGSFAQAYGMNNGGYVVGLASDRGFVAIPQ